MALPELDNHDARIQYYELMLEGDITGMVEIPLPEGYFYAFYQDGDRDAWIEIEKSAKEFSSYEEGLDAWKRYYEAHESELYNRMVFVVNRLGEKVATATAFYDVRGIDQSGAGWLHWVAVKREEQGKGLSKPLISHVIQVMKQLGYSHGKVPTQTTTWLAVKVYLDLGFRPIEKNYIRCRDGWRIIKRLTNHPALSDLDAASDAEVLAWEKQPMTIDILTIFPEMFESVLNTSIIGRAREQGLITIEATDIRPFSGSKHKNTDDYPFGGGAGMLMMAQPIADCMKAVCEKRGVPCRDNTAANESPSPVKRIYLSPRGVPLTQKLAQELSKEEHLILLCGHYEGVDQRALDKYIDMEVSIGDYVLTGGELGAMVLSDCVARLIPGVLGSEESPQDESFSDAGLLEYPQYTRPREFEGMTVPEVLLNGDHAKIAAWRREQAIIATAQRRPDLLDSAKLNDKEKALADQYRTDNHDQ